MKGNWLVDSRPHEFAVDALRPAAACLSRVNQPELTRNVRGYLYQAAIDEAQFLLRCRAAAQRGRSGMWTRRGRANRIAVRERAS